MAIIDTALVSNGNLLIQLDDGTVVNAGRVAGPQGPAGRDGQDGSPGIPGAKGDAGENGAKWHTGVGAPEVGLGENGDLYMDVASALLPIYQKVNRDWLFLANLKATSSGGVGATGESAAGDGSAVIIFPSPQPGAPGPDKPTADNDGKPIQNGDLWYDPITGHLWVYYNNQWTPISDRPPVIVGPNPPDYNSSSEDGSAIQYPLQEGDLWFDSAQAALYVAALNSDDDLVWVISTPADRSILQEEIPVGGFIFPAATQDGDTVFNDTTGLWYIYNASKKQWIDLPHGERELSYPGILREADSGIDETYEGEADAADGDVYLNAPDHETGTRLVVRKVDRKGFAWTDLIQGLAEGDGIALIQTNYDNGPDNPQTQRVDYLIVTNIVENPDSFSIEVDYEQQNFDHDPLFDEEVSVRFLAQVSSPAVCVTFQEATPEPKCVGHLWFDSSEDDYTLYLYDGNEWVPAAPPVSLEGIEQSIYHISEKLSVVETGVVGARVDIAGNAGEIEAAKVRLEDLETSQAVQDGQIIELEEEIESLAPSLDRGKWDLVDGTTIRAGEYAMGIGANRVYCEELYAECLATIDGNPNDNLPALTECNRIAGECFEAVDNGTEYYMNDWSHATLLHFHKTDSDGKTHTFADYEVGMFIDLFDQGDSGYAVFEITAEPTLDGDIYTIGVTPVQHEGEAAGLARVKVFELTGADPTDFVRKTGDTMSGTLHLESDTYSSGGANYPKVRFTAPTSDGNGTTDISVHIDGAYLHVNSNLKNAGTLSAHGNLQYNGETRVGMSANGGYLGKGTSASKRALEWDADGEVIKIQAWNGFGQQGQVLSVGANNTLMWATPAPTAEIGPAQLSWKYQKPASGKGPADGTFWLDSSHFRFSYVTSNGINLGSTKPANRDEWYAAGARDNKGAFDMTLWRKTSSGWYMYDHIECDKTRWSITTDGVTHFQFRRKWASHDKSLTTGNTYYITVAGWF